MIQLFIVYYLDTNKTTFSQVKNTIRTGDTIYLMSDISGNVEYITVSTGSMKGPYTVTQSDINRLLSQETGVSLMRNGVKCNSSEVLINDIVYYLPETNTVFAYSKKVTGVYEKSTPNRDMPNSVTVSGNVRYVGDGIVVIDDYDISVYNDKSQTKGGRVRVIVARE